MDFLRRELVRAGLYAASRSNTAFKYTLRDWDDITIIRSHSQLRVDLRRMFFFEDLMGISGAVFFWECSIIRCAKSNGNLVT